MPRSAIYFPARIEMRSLYEPSVEHLVVYINQLTIITIDRKTLEKKFHSNLITLVRFNSPPKQRCCLIKWCVSILGCCNRRQCWMHSKLSSVLLYQPCLSLSSLHLITYLLLRNGKCTGLDVQYSLFTALVHAPYLALFKIHVLIQLS